MKADEIKAELKELSELEAMNNAIQVANLSSVLMMQVVCQAMKTVCKQLANCETCGELVDTLHKFRDALPKDE
jgi:hypothetical protein